jgi:hypothetical protein
MTATLIFEEVTTQLNFRLLLEMRVAPVSLTAHAMATLEHQHLIISSHRLGFAQCAREVNCFDFYAAPRRQLTVLRALSFSTCKASLIFANTPNITSIQEQRLSPLCQATVVQIDRPRMSNNVTRTRVTLLVRHFRPIDCTSSVRWNA